MVKVPFTTDSTKFEKGLGKMKQDVKSFRTDVGKELDAGAANWLKYAGAVGAVSAAILAIPAAIGGALKKGLDFGNKISDQASEAATGIEELQVLFNLAMDAGAQDEQVIAALKNIKSRAVDAKNGMVSYQEVLSRLNIDYKTFADLPVEKQLDLVARGFRDSEDEAQAYRDILVLLGEDSGPKMVKVLNDLAENGFSKLNQEMKESGKIIEKELIQQLDEAQSRIDNMLQKINVVVTKGAGNLASLLGQGGDKDDTDLMRAEFNDMMTFGLFGFTDNMIEKQMNERNANLEFDLNERRKAKKSGKLPVVKEEPKINLEKLQPFMTFRQNLADEVANDNLNNKLVSTNVKDSKSKKSEKTINPTVPVSSLASIGGGGGVSQINQQIDLIRDSNKFLEMIAMNTAPPGMKAKSNSYNGRGR